MLGFAFALAFFTVVTVEANAQALIIESVVGKGGLEGDDKKIAVLALCEGEQIIAVVANRTALSSIKNVPVNRLPSGCGQWLSFVIPQYNPGNDNAYGALFITPPGTLSSGQHTVTAIGVTANGAFNINDTLEMTYTVK